VQQLQLQLPSSWWQQCVGRLEILLACQWPLKPDQRPSSQAMSHSLAVAVWSLGKAQVPVSQPLMHQIQSVALQLVQHMPTKEQQQQNLTSVEPQQLNSNPQTWVMLLVGLVRLAATAAHQLPPQHGCKEVGLQHHKQQRPRHRHWATFTGIQAPFLQGYCCSLLLQIPELTPTGLVAMAWCFGKLRYHPGAQFMAEMLKRARQLLPELSARHLAVLLWSLLRLQHVPGEVNLARLLDAWDQRLASATVADIQQMRWVQQQLVRLELQQGIGASSPTKTTNC